MTKITYIPGEIANAAIDEHGNRKPVTRTHHIFDDAKGKRQSTINQEVDEAIGNDETPDSIKGRIKGLEDQVGEGGTVDERIALEKQRAEGVESGLNNRLGTVEQLAEISIGGGDAQIATGADFTNPDATKRAKVPTVGAIVDGLNDGIYDVSKRNPTAGPNSDGKFTLEYILSNADTLIPTSWQQGGMIISFVDSSDNKYVQYRLMSDLFNTTVANWQGVDEEPTAGSDNLVKSGGVAGLLIKIVGMGIKSGGTSGVTAVGDIYYNTTSKLLKRCTDYASPTNFVEVTEPYLNGAVYTYNNELYIWNGTNLISKTLADNVPTLNSNNLVKSGGVKAAINEVNASLLVEDVKIMDNKSKTLGNVLEVTNPAGDAGSITEYQFIVGGTYRIYNNGSAIVRATLRLVPGGSTVQEIGYISPNRYIDFTVNQEVHYLRLAATNVAIPVSLEYFPSLRSRIETLEDVVETKTRFDFPVDVLETVPTPPANQGILTAGNILPYIYEVFDGLVSSFPNLIERIDLGSHFSIPYPEYANGIEEEGTYLVTPAYKTYVYRLHYDNSNIYTENNKKRSLVIVAGTHGDEACAIFNTYILAKEILNMECSELFKLLSYYDISIIPVINGYGSYHVQRTNANGVNINRNYPCEGWVVSGEGTANYTGASPASEFETQLVMAWVNEQNTDVLIDHHNYGSNLLQQFYTEVQDIKLLPLTMESLINCSKAFIKALPAYFGTKFQLLKATDNDAPAQLGHNLGTTTRWGYEKGITAATVEMGGGINYENGVPTGLVPSTYGKLDALRIGEFTLRDEVLRFCEYNKNYVNKHM